MRAKRPARLAPGIGEEFQRPARGDRRVELAQRAGRDIARVGEDRLAGGRALGVDREKPGPLHVDFAAHLDDVGPARRRRAARHRLQRADVRGDVLAGDAVAARRAEHQPAALVAQRRRQPVDLRLGHDLDRILGDQREILRAAEEVADAGEEIAHVLFGEGVVERQHRHAVGDLGEAGGRRRADPADGLSARISSGKRASIAALRRRSAS